MNFNTPRTTPFQTYSILLDILEAFRSLSPEALALAGEELRNQNKLTEEQMAEYDKALASIDDHKTTAAALDARSRKLEASEEKLAADRKAVTTREQQADSLIVTLNARDAATTSKEDELEARERDVLLRETAVSLREQAAQTKTDELTIRENLLAERTAKLKAAANDVVA